MKKKTKNIDMTYGSIAGTLLAFTLPLFGSSLCQQLYNTVDFLFIGNLLSTASAAAVGASSTLISCEIGLFSGISIGTSVAVAQAIGAGDRKRAETALHSSVAFGLIGSLLLMIFGILFARPILVLLNTPQSCIGEAVLYLRIYTFSLPFMVFYNMGSGAQRAYGDSDTPFRILVACGLVNVVADAFFLVVIPLGIAGVAIATMISQALSAVLTAKSLMRADIPVNLIWKDVRIDRKALADVLRIGIPSGVQSVVITFSNIIVQYYINDFGETAVAAFATYYKVENIIYLPIVAFGQAATAFSGQNTGAGQYSRIRRGTWIATGLCAAITVVIAAGILLSPRVIFRWFMKDPEVVTIALKIALVSFPFYWIYPILEVCGGSLRGMGYSMTSMVTVISTMCVLRVALLAFFTRTAHTISALAAVYPITWAFCAAASAIEFMYVIRRKVPDTV